MLWYHEPVESAEFQHGLSVTSCNLLRSIADMLTFMYTRYLYIPQIYAIRAEIKRREALNHDHTYTAL